jgi:LAS superfamily LD-carboxypeptidase LdcB
MILPIAPLSLPANLASQANGQIDPSLMIAIHPRGTLHTLAARAFAALVSDAGNRGLPLTFTYGGCYRTYDDQEKLFRQRYTVSPIAGAARKWWQNQWWYLRPGNATAATPGTSNHGLGLAIDTAFDTDPTDGLGPDDAASIVSHPMFGWFMQAVGYYGFSFELQSEPWHIRYVAGDAIPQGVLDFEGVVIGQPDVPVFDPINGKWGLYPIANKPVAKYGDKGDYIKYLQGVLRVKAGQNISVDGNFGHGTEEAVKNIQRLFKVGIDGWLGPVTWSKVDWLAVN